MARGSAGVLKLCLYVDPGCNGANDVDLGSSEAAALAFFFMLIRVDSFRKLLRQVWRHLEQSQGG